MVSKVATASQSHGMILPQILMRWGMPLTPDLGIVTSWREQPWTNFKQSILKSLWL